jgi:hypothetical protein
MFWKPNQPAGQSPTGAGYLAQHESKSSEQSTASTVPSLGGGDQDRIAVLEAQMGSLTQQNTELLLRIPGQSHLELNRDEHEEEECNNHTNCHNLQEEDRWEDDHQKDNFREDNHREQRNRRANCHGDRREDVGDLSRIIDELERRWTYMEMEKKDKSKPIVLDKLLLCTSSPFTRRVANYQLPEMFKVLQILSYVGDGYPLDHLENFQAHLDLHGTPDDVVCWAFPLTLSANAWDWFRKLPLNSVDKFKELCLKILAKIASAQ